MRIKNQEKFRTKKTSKTLIYKIYIDSQDFDIFFILFTQR